MALHRGRRAVNTLCLWTCLLFWSASAAAVQIEVVYADAAGTGFFDPALGRDRRTSFRRAADTWGGLLAGDTTIRVEARFRQLGGSEHSAILGSAGPSWIIRDFEGAPLPDAWYVSALADNLGRVDFVPGDDDMRITFNSDIDGAVLGEIDWHYRASTPTGADIDFQTVAMHEIGHGLGFFPSFRSDGTWGYDGRPMVYDTMLVNAAGQRLIDLPPSTANVTHRVYFTGPNATRAWRELGRTGFVPIFAPPEWRQGSSISHVDEWFFFGDLGLMSPYYDTAIREIDPVTLGILADLGWVLRQPGLVIPEPGSLVLTAAGALVIVLRGRRWA